MFQLVDKKKIDCFSFVGIFNHCNIVFEAMGCDFYCCPYQESRPCLTDNEMMRKIKKGEQKQMARIYPTEKIQIY